MAKFLTTLFLLFCLNSLLAQKVKVGLNLGMPISGFKKSVGTAERLNYDKRERLGGEIGFVSQIQLNHVISLKPELLYSSRGAAFRKENTEVDFISFSADPNQKEEKVYFRENYKLAYLTVPLLIGFNTVKLNSNEDAKKEKFDFNLGVSIAFNTSSKLKTNSFYTVDTYGSNAPIVEVKERSRTKNIDYATPVLYNWIIGANYYFEAKKTVGMAIDFRVIGSLNNVFSESEDEFQNNLNTKMTTFTLSYRVFFN